MKEIGAEDRVAVHSTSSVVEYPLQLDEVTVDSSPPIGRVAEVKLIPLPVDRGTLVTNEETTPVPVPMAEVPAEVELG